MRCPGQDKSRWKPEDIYDLPCPKCSNPVEFFKDDIKRECANCGHTFRNPKLDKGCSDWCSSADVCEQD